MNKKKIRKIHKEKQQNWTISCNSMKTKENFDKLTKKTKKNSWKLNVHKKKKFVKLLQFFTHFNERKRSYQGESE